MSEQGGPKVISIEEAKELLGDNVVIALEPSGNWVFDPNLNRIRRLDNRFYDIRMMDAGGYEVPAIYEEPAIQAPTNGGHRVIANIQISVNPRGRVKVQEARGDLDGDVTTQVLMSSLSNPEMVADASAQAEKIRDIKSNRNRISGHMRAFLVHTEFPDEEGMTPEELAEKTDDGRTLAALKAFGL